MYKFFLETLPNSPNQLELLNDAIKPNGIIEKGFPLLYATKNFQQNKHHAEDLWTHVSSCYVYGFNYSLDPIFSLGAMLHDIGKVLTRRWDNDRGDYTFHGHEGPEVTNKVNKWLLANGFFHSERERICLMIRHHLFRFYPDTKESTIRYWLADIGPQGWKDLSLLRIVDRIANQANKDKVILTSQYLDLQNRINTILNNDYPVFIEDLALTREEITNLLVGEGYSKEKFWPVVRDCLNLTYQDINKNTKEELRKYILRVYSKAST